ncbi:MGMT family protein [Arthrobacter sp.]|uniref:MGMT family protein n=1 Tax=Arthrobacter sp. TaxID=1667 RepID=UPI0033967615
MREAVVEAVLDLAAIVPPGRVLSYGDVAELLEVGGPRQIGRIMSLHGDAAPWWRIIRANGSLPDDLMARALVHYRQEGTPLAEQAAGPAKVRMAQARWMPQDEEFAAIERLRSKVSEATDGVGA